jgi:putative Mg2+ transporter-C (MgtC) family protein
MTPELAFDTQVNLGLRLTLGLVLGAIVGFEREFHRQPAGFRTHSLVALGSALFTIVSGFAFDGPGADPTRIAAQIVSGIGFIGAGTILQYRGNIRGLTTAASLWSVAAVGMAAGAGMWILAIMATVLMLIVLSILDRVERLARRRLGMPADNYEMPTDAIDDGRSEDLQ